MCIIHNESIAFRAQVEGTRGDIFPASPVALQSRCKWVPNAPIPMYGHSWPYHQSLRFKLDTDSVGRNSETAIEGRYAMYCVVLTPGTE